MSVKDCPMCGKLVDERHRRCAECGYDWAVPEDAPELRGLRRRTRMIRCGDPFRGWPDALFVVFVAPCVLVAAISLLLWMLWIGGCRF